MVGIFMKKQRFYDATNILNTNSQYMILLGERSNGKSYQAKKFCIDDYKKNGHKFMFLRRAQIETKAEKVETYFSGDILSYLQGLYPQYNYIQCYRNRVYFASIDYETMKITRGEMVGYVAYLSGATHFKSLAYDDCQNLIYEEFVTEGLYLPDEPTVLQDFISTVFRRREGKVFLIGNVITRVCPYFYEWQLTRIPKQKQGTIDIYEFNTTQFNDDGSPVVIKIAVEYCENSGNNSKMFFGHSADTITTGAWKTYEQAKQPEPNECYEVIYEFIVEHMNFSFVCQLKVNIENGGFILFVYPNTRSRTIERVITKRFSDSFFITERLNPKQFEIEQIVQDCFRLNKICFSDNLTGTDFNDIINDMGGI